MKSERINMRCTEAVKQMALELAAFYDISEPDAVARAIEKLYRVMRRARNEPFSQRGLERIKEMNEKRKQRGEA